MPVYPETSSSFENIVLVSQDGTGEGVIFRYTPASDWFDNHYSAEGMAIYTGLIEVLSLSGEPMISSYYQDGVRAENPNARVANVICDTWIEVQWTVVTAGGMSSITEFIVTEYEICQNTGSGLVGSTFGSDGAGPEGGGNPPDGDADPIGVLLPEECPVGTILSIVGGEGCICELGEDANGDCLSEEDAWEEKIDDTNLKPCMQTILTDLKNLTQGVGQTIQMFAGTSPGYNWEVRDGGLSQGTGMTSPSYNSTTGTVTTTFDSQSWLNATELSWARTMLHESMHAYFVAYYSTNRPGFLGTYQQMVQDWNTYQNWNDVHHEEFARSLVAGIADALEEYGINSGYTLSKQFYNDMSWAGLQGTTTFQNLSPSDQQRIIDVIATEATGQDTSGTTQNQKGTNAGC